jgi:molecular chaperone DnaK
MDGQEAADIRVFQGEEEDTRYNSLVGEFNIQGLADVPAPNQIVVRLDLDLNGILKVTATEKTTGLAKNVVIDNMMERFRRRERVDALERIDALFEEAMEAASNAAPKLVSGPVKSVEVVDPALKAAIDSANELIAKSGELESSASSEDAAEMKALVQDLRAALTRQSLKDISRISAELENLVFYLNDA